MDLNNLSKDQLLAIIYSQGIKFDVDISTLDDEIKQIKKSSIEFNYNTESYEYVGVNWKRVDTMLIAKEKKIIVFYSKKNGGMDYIFKSIYYESFEDYNFEKLSQINEAHEHFLKYFDNIEFPKIITNNIIVVESRFKNFINIFKLMKDI